MVSEETLLAEEVAQWDKEDPGWDREGRIAAAEAGFRRGYSFDRVASIHTEEIAREAQKRASR